MEKEHKIRIGLIQQANSADIAQNMCKLAGQIVQCVHQGAQLIVLPELHNSLYFCQVEDPENIDLAEPVPGPSTDYYGRLAREHGVVLVTSLFEKRAAGISHNTVVVIDSNGEIAGKYRKMHIPDDPGFYEKYYFTPGDLGFEPIDTSIGRLGVLICWDQWYPEAARIMALKGAEILIYPTAIGWDMNDDEQERTRQLDAWMTVQRGHAVANGLPLLAVNRVGWEPDPSSTTGGIVFWGNSFVCGPQGEVLSNAGAVDEKVVVTEIDLGRTERVRRIWPFFRDRRTEYYRDLLKLMGND